MNEVESRRGKRKIRAVMSGLLLAFASSGLPAAEPEGREARGWHVGAGMALSQSPYRDYDRETWPVPIVRYEGKRFQLQGLSGKYRLHASRTDSLEASLSLLPQRFDASRSDDTRLRLLDDRNISFMAGIDYTARRTWGVLRFGVESDVSGNSNGQSATASYGLPLRFGRLSVIPSAGMRWDSDRLNDYYYGVDAREAERSGLAPYEAAAGVTPYAAVNLLFPVNDNWTMFIHARYSRLNEAVKDSPMVNRDAVGSFAIAASRRF